MNYHILRLKEQMLVPGSEPGSSDVVLGTGEFLDVHARHLDNRIDSISLWALQLPSLFDEDLNS